MRHADSKDPGSGLRHRIDFERESRIFLRAIELYRERGVSSNRIWIECVREARLEVTR